MIHGNFWQVYLIIPSLSMMITVEGSGDAGDTPGGVTKLTSNDSMPSRAMTSSMMGIPPQTSNPEAGMMTWTEVAIKSSPPVNCIVRGMSLVIVCISMYSQV